MAVALSGCGSDGSEEPATPGATAAAPTTSAPVSDEPTEEQASSLPVSAFEYGYDMAPPTMPGTYSFEVTNDGSMVHDMVLEGEGVLEATAKLDPGESDSFVVDLAPGTYTLYCSVGSHRAQGMELTFSVA